MTDTQQTEQQPAEAPMPDTIEGNWREYRTECTPEELSDDELAPVEAAYLAGAASAYELVRRIASNGVKGGMSREEAKLKLTLIGAEIRRLGEATMARLERFEALDHIGPHQVPEAQQQETQVP